MAVFICIRECDGLNEVTGFGKVSYLILMICLLMLTLAPTLNVSNSSFTSTEG